MTSIIGLLEELRDARMAHIPNLYVAPSPANEVNVESIPTLDPMVERPVSAMLRARLAFCGKWPSSTHGDWLTIEEMKRLAHRDVTDTRTEYLLAQLDAAALDWINDAAGIFLPRRLSVFAASEVTYERVYLLWLDEAEEPEVWAYDANGLARYVSLEAYVRAHITGDMSAYNVRWILSEQ